MRVLDVRIVRDMVDFGIRYAEFSGVELSINPGGNAEYLIRIGEIGGDNEEYYIYNRDRDELF